MTTQTSAAVPEAFGQTLGHIAAANQKAMVAAARISARQMQGMLEAQQHLFDFAARRFNRDLAAAKKLSECKDAPEMVAVTQSFCAETLSDYADEATALMRLGNETVAGSALPE